MISSERGIDAERNVRTRGNLLITTSHTKRGPPNTNQPEFQPSAVHMSYICARTNRELPTPSDTAVNYLPITRSDTVGRPAGVNGPGRRYNEIRMSSSEHIISPL